MLKKKTDLVIGEWQDDVLNGVGIKFRKLEYSVFLHSTFLGSKTCKTVEYNKLLKCIPATMYVLDTESFSDGVLYTDCFSIKAQLCLTKYTATSTRLIVHSSVNFIKKPNFIIKGKLLHLNFRLFNFFYTFKIVIFIF